MYYGTIARAKVKPGKLEDLKRTFEGQGNEPDSVAVYVYQTDADPNEIYIAAIFKDREAYLANADSPEQNERYLQLRQWLEADPEWHDGEIIFHHE
jgi:quinol monooxygenase YgiN